MDTIRIRQGATHEDTLHTTDSTAETAMLTISKDGVRVAQEIASFSKVDEKYIATIKLDTTNIEVGLYEYMYTIDFGDAIVKMPLECNEGACTLPVFEVCQANDLEVV